MMSIISTIKGAVDIVSVAEQYVVMRKFGKRYKGLCPFHSEKTPSFVVYPDEGRFKCFGCQESGDVIDLYRRFNDLDNKSAIKQLAELYNICEVNMPTSEPSDAKVQRFLDKKRTELRLLLNSWLFTLEERLFEKQWLDEYERQIYDELNRLEYWVRSIDNLNDYSLKRLYDHAPGYVMGLYPRFWGEAKEYERYIANGEAVVSSR